MEECTKFMNNLYSPNNLQNAVPVLTPAGFFFFFFSKIDNSKIYVEVLRGKKSSQDKPEKRINLEEFYYCISKFIMKLQLLRNCGIWCKQRHNEMTRESRNGLIHILPVDLG